MRNNKDEIILHRQPWNRNIAVFIKRTVFSDRGIEAETQALTLQGFEKIGLHGVPPEPTVAIEDEAAQQLINSLWFMGYRPEITSSLNGELAAKDAHIHDLRSLVFKDKVEPKP